MPPPPPPLIPPAYTPVATCATLDVDGAPEKKVSESAPLLSAFLGLARVSRLAAVCLCLPPFLKFLDLPLNDYHQIMILSIMIFIYYNGINKSIMCTIPFLGYLFYALLIIFPDNLIEIMKSVNALRLD